MPAISTGKVLLTGANGYIAVWAVKYFLEAGFSVRGTVRSESKATHLHKLFGSYGNKFETVVVPDITKAESFAPHLKDIDAVAHTASPFHMHALSPDELIVPAVGGTLAILNAVHAHGPSVQRVIILSSTAAVIRASPTPLVLDERAWNEADVADVHARGRECEPGTMYRASKALAERAAWDWVEERKREGKGESLGWDLVVLNPPFVFGPVLHEVDKPENLNTSMHQWYFNVVKSKLTDEQLATVGAVYVDVRDIARAHVLALQKPEAGGERLIISSAPYKWQDWVSIAHRLNDKIPAGNASYDRSKVEWPMQYDNSKSIKKLGIVYNDIETVTRDTLEDFKARGWL